MKMIGVQSINGWAIVSSDGTFIIHHTFKRTRSACIKEFASWFGDQHTWRRLKRKGYTCQKVKMTIETV